MKPEIPDLRAPDFPSLEWLHSVPLKAADLRGRAVLAEFWDYASIHCLRALPYVRGWHERYAARGLVVVGVHSPAFPFGRDRTRVEQAAEALGIRYPVALDPDFLAWHAFHNRFWPSRYLFDAAGALRYFHFGERDYEACERAIQECLSEIDADGTWPEPMAPLRPEDRAAVEPLRATPELYLGIERGRLANAETARVGESARLALPGRRDEDAVYGEGGWRFDLPFVESSEAAAAALHVRYTATEVHLVAEGPPGETIELEIAQDGAALAEEDRGDDARAAGSGAAFVAITEPRLYRLVTNRVYATRDLRLAVDRPGLRVYALTFVSGPALS